MRRSPLLAAPTRAVVLVAVLLVAVLLVAGPAALGAQQLTSVRGVAYDSIAKAPLAGAFVTLGGTRSAVADERGRFRFDEVPVGEYGIEMLHAVLDTMGLTGVRSRVRVMAAGVDDLVLAVPSFATLWRAACGDRPAPADSGIVYGRVRDARDGKVRPGAEVIMGWTDLTLLTITEYRQKHLSTRTRSDEDGAYGFCGVPMGAGLRVQAVADSSASGILDAGLTGLRVMRRDLLLGPLETDSTVEKGIVSGLVLNEAGAPYPGATVVLDDVSQPQHTTSDGRFRIAGVQPGTRQLELLAIGVRPQVLTVDVLAGRVAEVTATLQKVTVLETVKILGSPWQRRMVEAIEGRRKQGLGRFVDSTILGRRPTMTSAFAGLPSVEVRMGRAFEFALLLPGIGGNRCAANLFIDGIRSAQYELATLLPQDIAVIEAYPRRSQVPPEFSLLGDCGAIVIWTKRVMP